MLTGKAASQARERSGYPDGGRHELLSLRLADSHPNVLAQAKDQDLVRHLVASHHGRCRPFAPVVTDERSLTVTFDLDGQAMSASSATGLEHLGSGVCERFWVLTRRYGWWGLAYLEACLRLADHRASEEAEQGDAS
jgi:CRISPR-associated endonuclease/helicase Cas3